MALCIERGRALIAVALAGLTITLLVGCVSDTVGRNIPVPTETAPLAVTIPMPDLGPSPTTPPLSDAEKEHQRLIAQDALWGTVLATYPDAVRPEVSFTAYTTDDNRVDVRSSCFAAAGLEVETGSTADGTISSVSAQPTNGAQAVSAFVCDAKHPSEPTPRPSDAQLGYVYDYLTRFLAPCYAANGIDNPAPPSREDFVSKWPNQNWFPSLGNMPVGTQLEEAIYTACPIGI